MGPALMATTGISISVETPWRTLQKVQPSRIGIMRSSRMSDGMRGESARKFSASRPLSRADGLEAFVLEETDDPFPNVSVVVDHQHQRTVPRRRLNHVVGSPPGHDRARPTKQRQYGLF